MTMPRKSKVRAGSKPKSKRKVTKKSQSGDGVVSESYRLAMKLLTGTTLEPGEIHPPVFVKGRIRAPKYLGPGTALEKKLRNKVQPISEVDRVARAHDSRYALAKNSEDVRNADNRMIAALDRISKNKSDNRINIAIGKVPIATKIFLEDKGLMKPGSFADYDEVDPKDRKMIEDLVASETKLGYGKKGKGKGCCKPKQSGRGKSAWVTHVKKYASDNNVSYREAMSKAGATYKK